MLKSITVDDKYAALAKDSLLNWNYLLDKNSIAASIYVNWEFTMMREANKRFVPAEARGLISIQTTKLIMWLQSPDERFGKDSIEGRNAFLKETFELAVDSLKRKLGDVTDRWQYGQANFKHIEFVHPLSSFVNERLKKTLNTESLPRGGYGHTVCSTGDADNQNTGASFRIIVDTKDWDKTLMINAPGQSGNPSSPYYKDLLGLWANNQYFPAYFSKAKILTVTTKRSIFTPH